jgi:hypothetical protein
LTVFVGTGVRLSKLREQTGVLAHQRSRDLFIVERPSGSASELDQRGVSRLQTQRRQHPLERPGVVAHVGSRFTSWDAN